MRSLFAFKPKTIAKSLGFFAQKPTRKLAPLLMMGGMMGYSYLLNQQKKAECCGIVAYVGKEPKATEVCLEGVQVLQFRGYDSCGLTTINEKNEFITTKFASDHSYGGNCIQKIVGAAPAIHTNAKIGIAHTRWATHGPKTDYNAHPHLDAKNRVAVVHNGIVDNYKECKAELISLGIQLRSETDTELIAQYIGWFLDQGETLFNSIKLTLETKVHGTWGLAIISTAEPDKLYLARNAGTLVVGFHDDFVIASSDVAAFQKYTNNYISVEENICVVEFNSKNKIDQKKIKTCEFTEVDLHPRPPYDHFFMQEIMEQPDGIARSTNYGARLDGFSKVKLGGLQPKAAELGDIDNLVITACGTSFYASLYGSYVMKRLQSFNTVQVIDSSEIIVEDFARDAAGILAVSQSGETKDVLNAVAISKKKGVTAFSVVNKTESELARQIKSGVFLNAGREVSVASTKAFTTQVVVLSLIAVWMVQQKHSEYYMINERIELVQNLRSLSQKSADVLVSCREHSKKIALMLKDHEHLFILGKGPGEAIAKEGALKIKEVSYIHAEGFCSGAFKHGPIALTDSIKKTPFILIILNDDFFDNMITTLNQVKNRQGTTIVITDCPERVDQKLVDYMIDIPNCGVLTALLGVLPLQLIAYDCAIVRGLDPDRPRHLAKEQTVQ